MPVPRGGPGWARARQSPRRVAAPFHPRLSAAPTLCAGLSLPSGRAPCLLQPLLHPVCCRFMSPGPAAPLSTAASTPESPRWGGEPFPSAGTAAAAWQRPLCLAGTPCHRAWASWGARAARSRSNAGLRTCLCLPWGAWSGEGGGTEDRNQRLSPSTGPLLEVFFSPNKCLSEPFCPSFFFPVGTEVPLGASPAPPSLSPVFCTGACSPADCNL